MSKYVRNQTPKRLIIKGDGDMQLILAPLERTPRMEEAKLQPFDTDFLQQNNYIRVVDQSETKKDWIAPLGGALATMFYASSTTWTQGMSPNTKFWSLLGGGLAVLVAYLLFILFFLASWQVVLRAAVQIVSLFFILTIGIALPFAVIYFFGGGRQLISTPSLPLLGRGLQFIFIATASLLPALLYFLFDRQQLGTLRERFDQQILRLDPNVKTLVDVRAKYGRQLDEIYGPELITDSARLLNGTRWPILVATLVITLGWILTLMPAESNLSLTQADELSKLFMPRPTALSFGFLGAYFFALHTISRRYTRADLKPKAYTTITVRIFIVIILAWVIWLPFGEGSSLGLMFIFFVGVIPETGLTYIQETLRGQGWLGKHLPFSKEKHALTELVGIDLYDRARLLDEGVTNIESLAHHDLIDLILETRIPVARLVDWVDQAILYLHLTVNEDGKTDTAQSQPTDKDEQAKTDERNSIKADGMLSLRQCLREYGIRTATDLMSAAKISNDKVSGEKVESWLFTTLEKHDNANLNRIKVILDTLADDEWLCYVEHWRENTKIETEVHYAWRSKAGSGAANNDQRDSQLQQEQASSEAISTDATSEEKQLPQAH